MEARPKKRPRLMKVSEVAEIFLVKPETVTEWARSGLLKSLRTPGGQYRFRVADIERELNPVADDEPATA